MYLAYIAALTAYGMTPRATLEIPGGARRLDRIVELIAGCRYSFHDLSRVEIDPIDPPTPRLNMAFELGLTVAWDRLQPDRHVWFVLESVNRRALKSLSDLAGTDVYIHKRNAGRSFPRDRERSRPQKETSSVQDVHYIYRGLQAALPGILKQTGAQSRFEAHAFREILLTASEIVGRKLA